MSEAWLQRPEGGTPFFLNLVSTLAMRVGRPLTRLLLYPIALYFLVRRAPERRASREYLSRVLGREAGIADVARHFHTFSGITLDRVFLLTQSLDSLDISTHGLDELHRVMEPGCGVLLIGAHFGSFDALRVLSMRRPDVMVRVVLDEGHSPMLSRVIANLNPEIARRIISPRRSGMTVALEIGDALQQGSLVTMLADRARPGNTTVSVDFLGAPAHFPTAPWQIASAMHVPVVLCLGIYRGGSKYELHFEVLSEKLHFDRRERNRKLVAAVQLFADRLAHYARLAPYNWFNFYDFWHTEKTVDRPVDAVDHSIAGERTGS
jgi:predicted LPLAT superfamily acyltransferase